MTDAADPFAADAAAVHDALEEINALRAGKRRAVLLTAAGVVAAGAAAFLLTASTDLWWLALAVAILGVIVLIVVAVVAQAQVTGAMQARVMPILCRMAGGFDYAAKGAPGMDLRAAGILPKGNILRSEDQVSGTLGETAFTSWDVTVKDERSSTDAEGRSTTNTVTLFRGLIVEARTGTGRDLALHRPRGAVTRFLKGLFGMDVETETIEAAGTELEVDAHPGEYDRGELARAAEALIAAFPEGSRFEGLLQRGGTAVIALHTGRDHYAMGGLFTSAAGMRRKTQEALEDLALPARIAATWAAQEAMVPRADA